MAALRLLPPGVDPSFTFLKSICWLLWCSTCIRCFYFFFIPLSCGRSRLMYLVSACDDKVSYYPTSKEFSDYYDYLKESIWLSILCHVWPSWTNACACSIVCTLWHKGEWSHAYADGILFFPFVFSGCLFHFFCGCFFFLPSQETFPPLRPKLSTPEGKEAIRSCEKQQRRPLPTFIRAPLLQKPTGQAVHPKVLRTDLSM